MPPNPIPAASGLLGDTPARDYAVKLGSFNRFAQTELEEAFATLGVHPGMSLLDAGCGTGETLKWMAEAVGPEGRVVGVDLSAAHVAVARAAVPAGVEVVQADLASYPLPPDSFDRIWSVNTLNHLRDPLEGLKRLASSLKRDGRIGLGQSSLLPEMVFAWDSRLERLVNEAVRAYYRDRYGLTEGDLAGIRALAGLLRRAGLRAITVRTIAIERLSPLDPATRDYLLETLMLGTWGERLRPYLPAADYGTLARLCDPDSEAFALDREDFHYIQTFTLCAGTR